MGTFTDLNIKYTKVNQNGIDSSLFCHISNKDDWKITMKSGGYKYKYK